MIKKFLDLIWVLTTRQALKKVCAISLVFFIFFILDNQFQLSIRKNFVCVTLISVKSKYGSCSGSCTGFIKHLTIKPWLINNHFQWLFPQKYFFFSISPLPLLLCYATAQGRGYERAGRGTKNQASQFSLAHTSCDLSK